MSRDVIVEHGPWRAEWGGGRLADVFHIEYESALAVFEVDGWDWSSSSTTATRADVERGLRDWIAEDAADMLRNLP